MEDDDLSPFAGVPKVDFLSGWNPPVVWRPEPKNPVVQAVDQTQVVIPGQYEMPSRGLSDPRDQYNYDLYHQKSVPIIPTAAAPTPEVKLSVPQDPLNAGAEGAVGAPPTPVYKTGAQAIADALMGVSNPAGPEGKTPGNADAVGTFGSPQPNAPQAAGVTFSSSPYLVEQPFSSGLSTSGDATGLLSLIQKTEAPAGYNSRFGENTQASTDLSNMTLNQVLSLPAKGGFSAAGGFQFQRDTLKELKDKFDLTGDELFTPELQDKLAMGLLERRGLNQYLSGKITEDQFADNLAKEWASLPLSNGLSYYADDGVNKAQVDRQSVLSAIKSLKGDNIQISDDGVASMPIKVDEKTEDVSERTLTGYRDKIFNGDLIKPGDIAKIPTNIIQAQAGKTRNQPISGQLKGILDHATQTAGVKVVIFSGGQPSTGPNRTGTHQHDEGHAGDMTLHDPQTGRVLNPDDPNDRSKVIQFMNAAVESGATGFGFGRDYMGNGIHVDYGRHPGGQSVTVWGAKGVGANAPQWLKQWANERNAVAKASNGGKLSMQDFDALPLSAKLEQLEKAFG